MPSVKGCKSATLPFKDTAVLSRRQILSVNKLRARGWLLFLKQFFRGSFSILLKITF